MRGVDLDSHTRCGHYHGPTDIVAVKLRCCGLFYACKDCHDELADHPITIWPKSEWDQEAVLCGACSATLSISQYVLSEARCAACGAPFNRGCRSHHHLYFQIQEAANPRPK
ncbi:MAG TPA: CHY zinc finger protein [Candidatus Eremiobacteraceae bacterium]|nr:CHY zinc finger protein [Candidatus Eremiobacteraceae bacterium]